MVGRPEHLVAFYRLECSFAPLSGVALLRYQHRLDEITDRTDWRDISQYMGNTQKVVPHKKRRKLTRAFLEQTYGGIEHFSLSAACKELERTSFSTPGTTSRGVTR